MAASSDAKIQNPNSLPWDPNNDIFPLRSELPKKIPYHPDAPEDSAWVWGEDDHIGRLNLLTPQRVLSAAKTEIRTGETVRLDLPLHIPVAPCFNRTPAIHRIIDLGGGLAYDDVIDNLNPQGGSQWDGFRHFSHFASGLFYNGTKATDITTQPDQNKCSIHYWSTPAQSASREKAAGGGISGRAVLLDYWTYAQSTPGKSYDPYTGHPITFADLLDCAKYQGINILPASQGGDIQIGDILLVRSGWVDRYNNLTDSQREKAAKRHMHVFEPSPQDMKPEGSQEWAGLAQDPATLTWLHDCYFSAVAGDAPGFERWPSLETGPNGDGKGGWLLHEYILALWGMPLGEMWDLEGVAEVCRRQKRSTFFLSSSPDMIFGGVSSHPNATAIF
ncbi:hypothetical protein EYB26_005488 [Talaromyces marneffei]|uniref:uncharacterized protein n=1 Tax=Talaromyces marneffei TaxID=37727 RepID=UPI0012A934F9|nr:uncharacterized protein EYB26_005488 [Talaromyces marneffei]QGA17812.1 hypothetical protein EYB26_005488 [Talaromyces marneffei]